MSQEKKKIVVIGGGYAGLAIAISLRGRSDVEFTMISSRDFFLHKISGLRAAVRGGGWVERTMIPMDRMVGKKNKLINAIVLSVNSKAKTIQLSTGEEISYDVLIIASGARNLSPGDAPFSVKTTSDFREYMAKATALISNAKSIVLVGSGAAGIELSGEIRERAKEVKITIVTRGKRILGNTIKNRESGIQKLVQDLATLNIQVIYEDEVVSDFMQQGENLKNAFPLMSIPNGAVTLKSGRKLDCDVLIYATGTLPNTDFLPQEWVDPITKELLVDPKTLQVLNQPNIFGAGDVAKLEFRKRATLARSSGRVAAGNALRVARGKSPNYKLRDMDTLLISLGSKAGRALLPFGTLGWHTTSLVWSRDLNVTPFWWGIAPHKKIPKAS